MTTKTAKELLAAIASDIESLDLADYSAIFQLGNIANRVIGCIDVVGNEIYGKGE